MQLMFIYPSIQSISIHEILAADAFYCSKDAKDFWKPHPKIGEIRDEGSFGNLFFTKLKH